MNAISRTMGAVAVALVVLTALPAAAEPANGVPFQPRTGWYAETQLGVFTALGGRKMFSNAQPYLGVSLGVDPTDNLSVFVSFAHGFNAGSCRDSVDGFCSTFKLEDGSPAASPEDFSVIPLEVGARYAVTELVPRLKLTVAATVGYTLLTPQVTETAPNGSAHAGLGVGVAYATRLPGLDVGAELLTRVAFSPMLPSLSIYPRIRYVF